MLKFCCDQNTQMLGAGGGVAENISSFCNAIFLISSANSPSLPCDRNCKTVFALPPSATQLRNTFLFEKKNSHGLHGTSGTNVRTQTFSNARQFPKEASDAFSFLFPRHLVVLSVCVGLFLKGKIGSPFEKRSDHTKRAVFYAQKP
jgi:hypothetical protein